MDVEHNKGSTAQRALYKGPDRRCRRDPGRRASDALPKVPCPHCGCSVSTVKNSRPVLSRNGVRRRRVCDDCGARFTTIEMIDSGPRLP